MFNTGQITLPKSWRAKFKTKKFVAQELKGGLLIKPLMPDETIFYENEEEFGLSNPNGINVDKLKKAIKKIDG